MANARALKLALMQTAGFSPVEQPSSGVFDSIPPCQGLVDILTDEPSPSTQLGLGNFTEAPDEQLLSDCLISNAATLFNGRALASALAQPLPLLKVRAELQCTI